jgi:hypothetical protein
LRLVWTIEQDPVKRKKEEKERSTERERDKGRRERKEGRKGGRERGKEVIKYLTVRGQLKLESGSTWLFSFWILRWGPLRPPHNSGQLGSVCALSHAII